MAQDERGSRTTPRSENITYTRGAVRRLDRERRLGQRGCVVWLTGLSAAGKSTLAWGLEEHLSATGRLAYVLDGDNVRHGLCADLGFSPADRAENIRRVGEVAALLADTGLVTIAAFVSPYRADRAHARDAVGAERFLEAWVSAPLAVCETRDPRGLYRKARDGDIVDFTGVSAPYEPPETPELTIPTHEWDVARCVDHIVRRLTERGLLEAPNGPLHE